YFQRSRDALARVRADPYGDFRRLGSELLLAIPESKRFRTQAEGHLFGFAWSKSNSLESAQCPDRLRNAGSPQADVALYGFSGGARSCVGDVRANIQGFLSGLDLRLQSLVQALRAELFLVDGRTSVAKTRIGKPITKRKLRTVLLVDVARNIFLFI